MGEIAKRARKLVTDEEDYHCNQLVHYALTGKKEGHLAKEFLKYGNEVTNPQEGDVVVGTNGKHCGIFVDSTHFVHASASQKKAVELESSELKHVFPGGHQIRRN
jgi:hypothetical protein